MRCEWAGSNSLYRLGLRLILCSGVYILREGGTVMKFYEKHPKISTAITFVFFALVGSCNFPIYNLAHKWSPALTVVIVLTGVFLYTTLGASEAVMFPDWKVWNILPLNLSLVLLSMAGRYLLEFGEVSNTYNFTIPNMLLHIGVTVALSTLFWFWEQSKRNEK